MLRRTFLPFACLVLGFAVTACGPSASGDDDDDTDASVGGPCTGNGQQCLGSQLQECRGGMWVAVETCANACDVGLGGCIDCHPGTNACRGADVVACNANGTFGNTVETCGAGSECTGGMCTRACSADGVDLIYVVDDTNNLLSFDPRSIGTPTNPFQRIGTLACPASPTGVPGWTGPVAPFSMAVDRDATAWVLYSSGQIFNVSTQNAACTATSFTPSQNVGGQAWHLFGMAYVTDMMGGDTEKLWIGGGNPDAQIAGDLGYLTPGTLAVNRVADLPGGFEYSPEFTGLGDATLWGFFPGTSLAFVQQIDKTSAAVTGNRLSIPGGLGGQVAAWAFAQWGGKFYVFVTTQDILGNTNSTVRTLDRATGQYQQVMQNLPYRIVGAGVSTCAPVVIGRETLPYEVMALPIDHAATYRK